MIYGISAMIALLFFFFLGITIHELGHLVFGLTSGYTFNSLRVGSVELFKDGSKNKFNLSRRFVLGQCVMIPSANEDEFKFIGYNLGGIIFSAIFCTIFSVMLLILDSNDLLSIVLSFGLFPNIFLLLYSAVPISFFGMPSDTLNAITASNSDDAKHGMYMMLRVEYELMNGKRYRDYDSNIFRINNEANLSNYFIAYILMLEAYRLIDLKLYSDAIVEYSKIDLEKLPVAYSGEIKASLMFCYAIHDSNKKRLGELFEEKEIVTLLKSSGFSFSKCLAIYEYFIAGNKAEAEKWIDRAKKEASNYPNKGQRIMELDRIKQLERTFLMPRVSRGRFS